jgi:hypothetical protein
MLSALIYYMIWGVWKMEIVSKINDDKCIEYPGI